MFFFLTSVEKLLNSADMADVSFHKSNPFYDIDKTWLTTLSEWFLSLYVEKHGFEKHESWKYNG